MSTFFAKLISKVRFSRMNPSYDTIRIVNRHSRKVEVTHCEIRKIVKRLNSDQIYNDCLFLYQ